MVLLTLVDRFDSPCGCEISQLLNFKWERDGTAKREGKGVPAISKSALVFAFQIPSTICYKCGLFFHG